MTVLNNEKHVPVLESVMRMPRRAVENERTWVGQLSRRLVVASDRAALVEVRSGLRENMDTSR